VMVWRGLHRRGNTRGDTSFDPDNEYDVVRYMESVPKGYGRFRESEFDEWAARIEETAREICGDKEGKRIKVTVTHTGGRSWIEVLRFDKDTLQCIIVSIRRHSMSMPAPFFAWFNGWQALLEIRRRGG